MDNKIEIDEELIIIKVLKVSGRRMTKSFFSQILEGQPYSRELNFTGTKMLGFVNDSKTRWLVYLKDDQIRKYDLSYISAFSMFNNNTSIQQLKIINYNLPFAISLPDGYGRLKDSCSDDEWAYIEDKIKKVAEILRSQGEQLFIAS